jgi:hypothetical protein
VAFNHRVAGSSPAFGTFQGILFFENYLKKRT